MIAEAMPLLTKVLFVAVGLALVSPALYNVWRSSTPRTARRVPRRRRDPYKPSPVTDARLRKLWVIDRDHER